MDPRGNQHQLFCFAVSLDGLVIIPHLSGKCNPFFEIFSKKFLKWESGGENLPLPSGPGASRPASPAVETPRPNRRVRVLPAAGEKTSRFPQAQARAAQPARLSKLRAQTGACASCPPQGRKPPASLGPKRGPPSQPSCRNSTPKQACARFARRRGESLPLPSGPGAGRPASPAVETPRPNRRVRVLPAAGEKKTAALLGDCFQCWRKPIFPGRHQPSIFGAGELNFRVRDGNGWTLAAINTNYFVLPSLSTAQ